MDDATVPAPSHSATALAVGLIILGSLAVAAMPSFTKLAYQDGVNPGTLVVIRTLTAVVLLGLYMLGRGRSFRLPMSILAITVAATVSSAAMNYSFAAAVYRMDISLTILIMFAHPFLVSLWFHLDGSSRMTVRRMFWAVVAFVGLGLALAVSFDTVSKPGLALASFAALACTAMVVAMVRVNAQVGGVTTNFHLAFWSMWLFAAALGATQDVQLPRSVVGYASSMGNGAAYVIAYLTYLTAVRLIGASRATVLSFMEPLAAILLAAALFDERLTQVQWLGVTLVAGGLLFSEVELPRRLRRACAR